MLRIRQEQRTVTAYVVEFHTLAIEARWSEIALVPAFKEGLNSDLQSELRRQSIWLSALMSVSVTDVPFSCVNEGDPLGRYFCHLLFLRWLETPRSPCSWVVPGSLLRRETDA